MLQAHADGGTTLRRYHRRVLSTPTFVCNGCGQTFDRRRDMLGGKRVGAWDYRQKYCTRSCFHSTQFKRSEARRAAGVFPDGHVNKDGYRIIKIGYGKAVKEHRLVMERLLGRELRVNENVHHKNGNRSDNDPSNLELWVKTQPCGQRVEDKVSAAVDLLREYPEFLANLGLSLDRDKTIGG